MDKVIMDTNAYRYFVKNKSFDEINKAVEKLKDKEKANNIETSFSITVAQELLAHVADKTDSSHEICRKAIKALYLHSGNHEQYNLVASFDMQICKLFFGAVLPVQEDHNRQVGKITAALALHPTSHVFAKHQHNLNRIRDHVYNTEIDFVDAMQRQINYFDPGATSWQLFKDDNKGRKDFLSLLRSEEFSLDFAIDYIMLAYITLRREGLIADIPIEELTDKVYQFVEKFPEPIMLYKELFERLVRSEFDMTKDNRANYIWDIQLMFNIGQHSIGGGKLHFITSDKAMIEIAAKTNAQLSVYTFNEYMEYVGLKPLDKPLS